MMTEKGDLYRFSEQYFTMRAYKQETVRAMQMNIESMVRRMAVTLKMECLSYDPAMARRNGVRYVAIDAVERWVAKVEGRQARPVVTKETGRELLSEYEAILRRVFGIRLEGLREAAKQVHFDGRACDLSKWFGEEEVKHYERICLETYGHLFYFGLGLCR